MLGKVPPSLSLLDESNGIDVGNGDLAPEWTVELEVEGGVINYGPWADRQRFVLFRYIHIRSVLSGKYIFAHLKFYHL